jgi:hypothetical protein
MWNSDDLRDGYLLKRGFLKSCAGNGASLNSYRSHVERLLLWSLLVAKTRLLEPRLSDAEQFLEYCLRPQNDRSLIQAYFSQAPDDRCYT